MKIAITGANGFIGRNLIHEINKTSPNTEVVALVRNASAIDASISANVIELDIHHPPSNVLNYIGNPDILIHLAWEGLPNYNSLHHFESELPKQYAFLSKLVKSGLKSLFVAGTCFEYGMQSGELSENNQLLPTNPYGFAKNTLREQLEYLQQENNFNLIWARLFYIYGDNQTGNSIFPQLKKALSNGDEIFNMSKGEQIRDYLEVKQVVKYILHLSLLAKNTGVVNICSGIPISMRSLVEGWLVEYSRNIRNIKLNLGYYSYPTYEPLAFWGSTEKLHTIMESK